MRKLIIILAAVALVLGACASAPKGEPIKVSKENKIEIIDDMSHRLVAPAWIDLPHTEIENNGDVLGVDKGKVYVFKIIESGKNLEGVKLWAQKFQLASQIADTVSTRVQSKFAGAAAGDKDALETYMEAVVKSMSNATYSGARKKAEYWWQIRKSTPAGGLEDTFEYHLLVVVPKDVLDKQIQMALGEAGTSVKPKNEEEKTARDRVKKAFDDTGLGE
jgi:hypothetical protein